MKKEDETVDKLLARDDMAQIISEFTEGNIEKYRYILIVGLDEEGNIYKRNAGWVSKVEYLGLAQLIYDWLYVLGHGGDEA